MRDRTLLVVSHDFPPVRSPQAIRAAAFTRGLAAEAAYVWVLTRSGAAAPGTLRLPDNVGIIEASPGWLESSIDWLLMMRASAKSPTAGRPSPWPEDRAAPATLNWKGKSVAALRKLVDQLVFPDGRALWVPDAARALRARLVDAKPDAAVVMHEPAASLLVARELTGQGVPWLADLADPVLAPYTPRQWRGASRRLEAEVIRHAAAVSVTNEATAQLLNHRHGPTHRSMTVLPQGFSWQATPPAPTGHKLRLVYTGRFYPFRDPAPLLDAVIATPGVELVIAGPEMPGPVVAAAAQHPSCVQLAGDLTHVESLQLQLTADVLVSVGNSGTAQSPGKLQEYFGASRPVLHLFSDSTDPALELLPRTGRGITCAAEARLVAETLGQLLSMKRSGALTAAFDLSAGAVAQYEWTTITKKLAQSLAAIIP